VSLQQVGDDSLRNQILAGELLGCVTRRADLNPMTAKSCPRLDDEPFPEGVRVLRYQCHGFGGTLGGETPGYAKAPGAGECAIAIELVPHGHPDAVRIDDSHTGTLE